jgi:hypothetical protein
MKTEQGSYDDPGGVEAIVATRDDAMTGLGLDDSAPAIGTETAGGYGSEVGTPSMSGSNASGDRLQDAAGGVAERVAGTAQEKASTQVDAGLSKAGEMVEQIAGAVRQGGDQLRDQQPQIATFVDSAAGEVDRFARYLSGATAQDVLRETENFARRQPAIFLGGAFVLGLVASRFLKASPQGGSAGSRTSYGSGSAYRGYDADSSYAYGGSSQTGVEHGGA